MSSTSALIRVWFPARRVAVVLAALTLTTALLWQSGVVRGQTGQAHFALNATGTGVSCDAPTEPQQCNVPAGGTFTLDVELLAPPSSGYIAIQTSVYVDGFTWIPRSIDAENVWPENQLPVRSPNLPGPGTTVISHGGLTALSSPFPLSHYEGNVVELQLACSQEPKTAQIALMAYAPDTNPIGTSYNLADQSSVGAAPIGSAEIDVGSGTARVPVAGILTIKCGGPSAAPAENLPAYTPNAVVQAGQTPGATTAPGITSTPPSSGTPRTAVSATATPGGSSAGKDNGGISTWVIIVVVVAALVVLGAAGGYWWYIRRRSATAPPAP